MCSSKHVVVAGMLAAILAGGLSSTPVGGQGAAPPILVVLNNTTAAPFGAYLPEILRAEGLNAFDTAALSAVTGATLANYRLVVLAETSLSAAQAAVIGTYVDNGGRLIAMRPDADLFGTLGITSQVGSSSNRPATGFLSATIDQSGPGAGLQSMSLPFRGAASHYALAGGTATVATISGGSAGGYPAVIRSGRTAAWSFDLARSVAYVRQGDPLDVNLDRDGQPIYRTNDIFYQRIDLQRVNVPHADVHMRLFARVIDALLADSLPLPRLWYFPGTSRTILLPTSDSHTSTLAPHTALINSAQGYGARLSIYLARYGSIPANTVTGWRNGGHEVGLHPYFDPDNLENNMTGGYTVAANWWQSNYPSFPYSPTTRHHSLEWTGWADPANVMSAFGIRLDSSFYAWGPALNNPTQQSQAHGYINGSGQPMRFVTEAGQVLPVYQQVTSLTDEQLITGSYAEGMTVPQALAVSRQLIDESQAGGYAAIMAQFHVDYYLYGEVGPWVDGTMAYAQSLQIPMWTDQRWLQFIETRAAATLTNVNWSVNDKTLTFTATLPTGAEPHTLLVPGTFGGDTVTAVAVGGSSVTAPSLVVNGRTMRAITLTAGAPRSVAVLYAVPTPAIAIGDITVTEGHAGTTVAGLPLTLSSPSSNAVTVNYQTVNGTAAQPGDYQPGAGTITFPPFATSQMVPVTIVGDLTLEANETFSVTLSSPGNATIEDGTGIVTISDDDAPPTITITDASVTEGNGGSTPASFTVSLSHASGGTVTVQYATGNGTATAGSDYTAGSGTLTFNPGVTALPIVVPVIGETAAEPNETFAVTLTAPVNGVFGDNQGVGTIINDDSGTVVTTSTFQVQSGGDDVNEEGSTFTADGSTVWVGSGAAAASSYAGFRFTGLTIPPGAVISSARLELRSSSSQWLTIGFEFAIEAAVTSAPFSAASRPSQRPLLAPRVQHSSNTQWLAGTWYQLEELASLLQPVVNQAGWASGNAVSLVVRGAGQNWARKFATAFEGGAAFAPRLVVTYSFVEASPPTLSIGDVSIAEGNSGTTEANFSVTLSAPSPQVVTANWATANGTATAGSDYSAASGTVTFPANTTTPQLVTVPIAGDTDVEPDETFVVNLTGPTNATIGDGQGTGTITNDDSSQSALSINSVSAAEGNAPGTQLAFTVTLSPASSQTVTVNYATANGTAQAGTDFTPASGTLTFAIGETTKPVSVPLLGDSTPEGDETLTVALSAPVNATITAGGGLGTITNDDVPALTLGNATVAEGTGATTTATFLVTLAPASTLPVTVNYATANGSATAGIDYTATSGALTFAPGETTKEIAVPVTADALDEPDETFTAALSAPTNATIVAGGGAGTITDDDGTPSLSISGNSAAEGQAGTTALAFTVTLSPASGQTVTVTAATANGTAVAGSDFVAASVPLSFAPGETTKTVNVTINGDTVSEANETFTVGLSAATNAAIGTASATGTITDDDGAPGLSINNVAVLEGNAGASPATFTVSLSPASGQVVTVVYTATAGTAALGSDFGASTGTLTFTPGETSQPVTVAVNGDTAAEADETFTVVLSSPTNATLLDGSGLGTITNDDGAPALSIGDVTVAEAAGVAVFTVSLSEAPPQAVTVNFATADATAVAGSDYTTTSGTLTFGIGVITQTLNVPIAGDTISEALETFVVNLSTPSNATIADGSATGSITDDDPQPALSISDAAATEGNAGTTNLVFTVTLTPASGQAVTVNYATGDVSAGAPADYAATSGTLTFAPGETVKTVTVLVVGDTAVELNETLAVTLSAPGNATIDDASGTGTITNDDAPTLSITAAVSVAEGNVGTTPAVFTVSLSAAASQTVTVNYATAAGTAALGSDVTATSGTLTFLTGETTRTVNVDVVGEALFEANETFTVVLGSPTGATIAAGTGTGTITNDDSPPALSISSPTLTEGNTGGTVASFTVTLSAASGLPATADYATSPGTASSGADFTAASNTVTIPAGSTTATILVTVAGDTLFEADETFSVTLSGPGNATLGVAAGVATITNDDVAPAISVNDVTVTEGNTGSVNAVFTVTLSAVSGLPASATFATSDVSATAGSDYTAVSTGVTIPAGSTSVTVNVPVLGDALAEASEVFTVGLSGLSGAAPGDVAGQGTIVDNDQPALSISDVTVAEGNIGTTPAIFTVSLSQPHVVPVTVTYATANGTATAPGDYTAIGATVLTIPAGATSTTLTVSVNGDITTEPNETFLVNLTAPANATITDAQGVGTITNDEAAPVTVTVTVQVAAGADDVNEAAGALTVNAVDGWIGNGASNTTNFAGFRFVNVPIPANATILSARLETQASSTQWQRMSFQFGIEAVANSPAFSAAALPSQRVQLGPKVNHTSNVQWLANTWYQLDDISTILQAAITQPGWQSGNALSLLLRGTSQPFGRKFVRHFEAGAALAPRLVVTYQVTP
jgi:hypothetical protein